MRKPDRAASLDVAPGSPARCRRESTQRRAPAEAASAAEREPMEDRDERHRRPSDAIPWAVRQRGGETLDRLLQLADRAVERVAASSNDPANVTRIARAKEAGWDDLLRDLGGAEALAQPERLDTLSIGGPVDPLEFWLDAAFGLRVRLTRRFRERSAVPFGDVSPPRLLIVVEFSAEGRIDRERAADLARRLSPPWVSVALEFPQGTIEENSP